MASPTPATLAFAGIALTALVLAVVGAPHDRPPPAPVARPRAPPAGVTVGGITLASTSVDLPDDPAGYPAGPHVDVVTANCSACHSASMALTQPRLTPDQWKAEIVKMREVYHAPVPDAAVAAILAYLLAMPNQPQHRAATTPATTPSTISTPTPG